MALSLPFTFGNIIVSVYGSLFSFSKRQNITTYARVIWSFFLDFEKYRVASVERSEIDRFSRNQKRYLFFRKQTQTFQQQPECTA